jgi:hypothetical protein
MPLRQMGVPSWQSNRGSRLRRLRSEPRPKGRGTSLDLIVFDRANRGILGEARSDGGGGRIVRDRSELEECLHLRP